MINVYLKKAEDELRLRNYSPKTIKNYIACLADYLCAKKGDFESVDTDFIKRFLLHKKDQGKSPRTTNQSLQAINFFCRNVLKITISHNWFICEVFSYIIRDIA